MKILGTRVLVRPENPISRFGNIVLPEAFVENTNKGTVILAGEKSTIKTGSTVVYMQDHYHETEYEGKPALFIGDEAIYAEL